ncbi:MAG: serine protease [Gammaproteobacteria bacterium]|nr:serine protease [Gammaproteobacteria bacterium]MDH3768792.1 serine protease [Gammaproteobacteria bacterium]
MSAVKPNRVSAIVRFVPIVSLSLLFGCTSFQPIAIETQHASYVLHYEEPTSCQTPNSIVLSSVVRVATGDGGDASGVVVSDGRVLTAAHVVVDAGMTLVRVNEEYRKASVMAIDQSSDLALLAVDTGYLTPVQLSHDDLNSYEEVWAIGFPLALDQVTTHGFFRNESQGRIFTSAPINAGASGGGLIRCLNGSFELAGLIRGYGAYRVGNELIPMRDLSIHTPAEQILSFVLAHDGTRL